ncbi:MAG: glycosyltransferase family 39 protein [Spirulina sp. SIO3F2]|nr:glycosyltransferase family 39 protein [Spirulina sp. SIO3F2]
MAGLTVICGLAFWLFLGSIGLVDETEPLFAEASRQMTVTGDWVTPYFNGVTRFDKPPLVYWLTAIAYLAGGVNEWTARAASALSATAITVGVFLTLQKFGFASPISAQPETQISPRTTRQRWLSAGLGAAALALNIQMIVWARTGVSDMLLCACLCGALLCFFWGYVQSEGQPIPQIWPNRWYLGFYVLLALAVLTKGPVGIVLPGLVIIAFSLYLGRLRRLWQEAKVWTGLGIFAVLTVPWYVLVIQANGQAYIDSFFGYHNVERFTEVVNGHAAPWYFYFLVILVGFAPWSVSLPLALARLRPWRWRRWQDQPRSAHLGLFALVWFLVIFGFFTVAVTKLPSYTIPLLPAAAILVALLWSHELTQTANLIPRQRCRHAIALLITAIATLVLLTLMAIAIFIVPNLLGPDDAAPMMKAALDQSWLTEIGAVIWGLGAVAIALLLLRRATWRWIALSNLIMMVLFVSFTLTPAFFLLDAQRQLPLRTIARLIPEARQPAEEVIMVGFQKPSVVFYSRDRVQYYFDQGDSSGDISQQPEKLQSQPRLLVIGHPKLIQDWQLDPPDYEILAQQAPYLLMRVQRSAIIDFYEQQTSQSP